jgi:fatty acid desaturase/predicted heme/steroid binding protein
MGKGGQNIVKPVRKISLEELGQHRVPGDAWMSFKGKVYDVSNWYDHPGGSVIFSHAGDDCTDIFNAFHPGSAMKEMMRFEIGELDESIIPSDKSANKLKPEKQKEFEKAYRELRAKMFTMGLFNANLLYYVFKVSSNVCIALLSIACAVYSKSFIVNFIGAVIMGLFWQQCGWLAHDFLHHQVFKNRLYGDLMGLVVGGIFQGFSVHWWKTKHNTHHSVPNLEASCDAAADGDPDIDTMPMLAWSANMAKQAADPKSAWGRFFVKYQAILYFPVLFFARLSWAHQSWVFVWGGAGQHSVKNAAIDRTKMAHPYLERFALVIHYGIMLAIMSQMYWAYALMYFFVAQTSCGLFLAMVFGVGHNGMAVYKSNERPDFWKLQVTTTRNVTGSWLVGWFCGGLHYQVEHHLFPMVPRHNLAKVHQLVVAFCKEQGVTYHETSIYDGNVEVLQHLDKVSREFASEFPAM